MASSKTSKELKNGAKQSKSTLEKNPEETSQNETTHNRRLHVEPSNKRRLGEEPSVLITYRNPKKIFLGFPTTLVKAVALL
ncbi:hypothetical protein QJS04_geneDACA013359 [Acorus gramineus]|uniref:Uncharacterized protein n=1 Tax=Acorus gramineus TaxID=55184 RepID=A0AAV9A993_ACOGR|nr:hypothetical protein QJS04_geneDACA013359 [Acorus gramineus]